MFELWLDLPNYYSFTLSWQFYSFCTLEIIRFGYRLQTFKINHVVSVSNENVAYQLRFRGTADHNLFVAKTSKYWLRLVLVRFPLRDVPFIYSHDSPLRRKCLSSMSLIVRRTFHFIS